MRVSNERKREGERVRKSRQEVIIEDVSFGRGVDVSKCACQTKEEGGVDG